MSKEYTIGLDLGGTKLAAALVDRSGQTIGRMIRATPKEGRQSVLDAIHETLFSLIALADKKNLHIKGIGIGSLGLVDYRQGVAVRALNLPGWENTPLRDIVQRETSLPVWVDNDVRAITWGEYVLGAAKGKAHAVCLALGTGVGGGVIVDGKLLRGISNSAGEFGHLSTNAEDGVCCTCGMRGCLQMYASGKALVNRFLEKKGVDYSIHDATSKIRAGSSLLADGQPLTGGTVFSLWRQGDQEATEVIEAMMSSLTASIVNLIHIFNPQVVVIGGGIAAHEPWLCKEVERRIQRMSSLVMREVAIVPSALGPDAGLIGAAMLPLVRD